MSRLWIVAAAGLLAVAPVGEAGAQGRSTGAVTLGAIGGGALGFIAGGLIGGAIAGRGCEPGNPDQCLGQSFPGYIWGAGAGMTVGIPTGAHLANRGAGNFGRTFAVSALIFGAEVLALNALVDDGRTKNKGLTFGIAAVAPVIQIIASVAMEKAGK